MKLFSLHCRCACQHGISGPLDYRKRTPCTFELYTDVLYTTSFTDNTTFPIVLELDDIGFTVLLLETALLVFELVRRSLCSAVHEQTPFAFLSTSLAYPDTKDVHQRCGFQPIIPFVRNFINTFSIYVKWKRVNFRNREILPEALTEALSSYTIFKEALAMQRQKPELNHGTKSSRELTMFH